MQFDLSSCKEEECQTISCNHLPFKTQEVLVTIQHHTTRNLMQVFVTETMQWTSVRCYIKVHHRDRRAC